MSKALKCDRCGLCFDPNSASQEYTGIKDLLFIDARDHKDHKYSSRNEELNFCPYCTELFKTFMKGEELSCMK